MNDPDNFLSRWSRRKQEAGEHKEKKEDATNEPRAGSAAENEPGRVASAPNAAPIPKFDAESLPPIESISAETDITAFMRAGVPEALKRAALRRVWSSDPSIRDFVGLNENYWDAAGPDGIAGFGDLDSNLDIKRMVSELFGEAPPQDASSDSKTDHVADSSVQSTLNQIEAANPAQPGSSDVENMPHRNEIAALQREAQTAEQADRNEPVPEKKFARRHGGAMPR